MSRIQFLSIGEADLIISSLVNNSIVWLEFRNVILLHTEFNVQVMICLEVDQHKERQM